jgi:hypothetical protein
MKHPSAGNNHSTTPAKGRLQPDGTRPRRNKGIKALRDQERRERAYVRGGTLPKEEK